MRVGIIGVGMTAFRPSTPEYNWKELMFEAALDPLWNKPLGAHTFVVAGLEAAASLRATHTSPKPLATVVAKNHGNALRNPLAAYGVAVEVEDAMRAPERFAPLRALDISNPADGCVVLVLASERAAKKLHSNPVWIRGVGWASDSPSLETRDWADAAYTRIAAEMAYRLAKLRRPATEIEVAEIDDRFSYKELQHVESLGLAKKGEAGKRVVRGDYGVDGRLPVNVSGGSLGCGNVFEATGLHRAPDGALQLP